MISIDRYCKLARIIHTPGKSVVHSSTRPVIKQKVSCTFRAKLRWRSPRCYSRYRNITINDPKGGEYQQLHLNSRSLQFLAFGATRAALIRSFLLACVCILIQFLPTEHSRSNPEHQSLSAKCVHSMCLRTSSRP